MSLKFCGKCPTWKFIYVKYCGSVSYSNCRCQTAKTKENVKKRGEKMGCGRRDRRGWEQGGDAPHPLSRAPQQGVQPPSTLHGNILGRVVGVSGKTKRNKKFTQENHQPHPEPLQGHLVWILWCKYRTVNQPNNSECYLHFKSIHKYCLYIQNRGFNHYKTKQNCCI